MKRFLFCSAGFVFALILGSVGCAGGNARQEEPPDQAAEPRDEATPFEGRLLGIARSYESYGMPNEEIRMTAAYCAAPSQFTQGLTTADHVAKVSSVPDSSPHGKKLYFLFVKEPRVVGLAEEVQMVAAEPVGQVVVKEAWVPEEVRGGERPAGPGDMRRKLKVRRGGQWVEEEVAFDSYVRRDDRLYRAKEKAGLFIMFKADPATPDTDQGWVYGTVTADGKQVTSAGRVESCMGCHRDAPHDRLFTPATQ